MKVREEGDDGEEVYLRDERSLSRTWREEAHHIKIVVSYTVLQYNPYIKYSIYSPCAPYRSEYSNLHPVPGSGQKSDDGS